MSCLNLVMNPPRARGAGGPGPNTPTLFRPGPSKPLQFTDVDALARHIHRHRGRRGLQIRKIVAHYGGSDTFQAYEVRWLYPADAGGHDEYAFTLAVQGRSQAALEAAIAAANPDQPDHA
jgi:hypothetical protein